MLHIKHGLIDVRTGKILVTSKSKEIVETLLESFEDIWHKGCYKIVLVKG